MLENYYFEALTYFKIKGIMFIRNVDILRDKDVQTKLLDELKSAGYVLMNDRSVWLSPNGFAYLESVNRLKKPESLNLPIASIKTIIPKHNIATRISKISFESWALFFTIISGMIALWFAVIKPIIDSLVK